MLGILGTTAAAHGGMDNAPVQAHHHLPPVRHALLRVHLGHCHCGDRGHRLIGQVIPGSQEVTEQRGQDNESHHCLEDEESDRGVVWTRGPGDQCWIYLTITGWYMIQYIKGVSKKAQHKHYSRVEYSVNIV